MIFEKIRERLDEIYDINDKFKKEAYEEQDWERFDINSYRNEGVYRAINIVNQVEAEYKEEYKSKCAECTRRKFYMMGYQAAKENNGWIPCSERLPEDGENVLLCIKGYEIQTGYKTNTRDGECFYMHKSEDYAVLGDVIAWQPLPEPYTPKGE